MPFRMTTTTTTSTVKCPVCGARRARLTEISQLPEGRLESIDATILRFSCRRGCEPEPETLEQLQASNRVTVVSR